VRAKNLTRSTGVHNALTTGFVINESYNSGLLRIRENLVPQKCLGCEQYARKLCVSRPYHNILYFKRFLSAFLRILRVPCADRFEGGLTCIPNDCKRCKRVRQFHKNGAIGNSGLAARCFKMEPVVTKDTFLVGCVR
jgi:hypothetical protein